MVVPFLSRYFFIVRAGTTVLSESDVMTSEFSLFMLGLLAKIKAGTIWKSSLFILSCLSDHQV